MPRAREDPVAIHLIDGIQLARHDSMHKADARQADNVWNPAMNVSEVERIEATLEVTLPAEYRVFLLERSDEVDQLSKQLTFVATPWTDADKIITENQRLDSSRDDMPVGVDRIPWPENYIIIGTNGAGDYWFVDTESGDSCMWFYGHETQEIEVVHTSFDAYLDHLRKEPERQRVRDQQAREKKEREYCQLVFDGAGLSSLHHAAQDRESTARLAALIDAGFDVNVRKKKGGETPLFSAAVVKNLPAVKLLVESGADVNATWSNGNSALHLASTEDIARLLLENGADPNRKNEQGWTPLHSAAFFGREEAMRQMLAFGADKSICNQDGKTPLDLATEKGKHNVIGLLQ